MSAAASFDRLKRAELESELIVLEAAIDQLLDRDLDQFSRPQAEALDRMASKLGRAGRQLRICLPRPFGSLGDLINRGAASARCRP